MKAKCTNCGSKNEIDIPKGTKLTEIECPTCGCKDLEKFREPMAFKPRQSNFR